MKKYNIIISIMLFAFCICGISSSNNMMAATQKTPAKTSAAPAKTVQKPAAQTHVYTPAKALDIVNNPGAYLNKRVKITAKFDKFSSLGLDYKPALRSSEKYITFLIKRDDVENNIPLSELKNFMKREMAEKYIDLETDDVIEYSGLVFSNALGDAWLEVENFKIITSKTQKTKNESK
ncbi:hypothetical protein IKE67_08140 [bacterium]|nr:hypothetical protein [bacterium]